jgi:hypothetical protein
MYYCLKKEELEQLIDFKISGKEIVSGDFSALIENSAEWQTELGCINYLLCQIIERKKNSGDECGKLIDEVYQLDQRILFRIHECDREFVQYMLSHVRQSSLSLEDELVTLHTGISGWDYGHSLRY